MLALALKIVKNVSVYTQSSRLSIQVNLFSRIGTKIWNKMPVSLRKHSKMPLREKQNKHFLESQLQKTVILISQKSFNK